MNDPTSYPLVLTSLLASAFALAVLTTPSRPSTTSGPYRAPKGPKMPTTHTSPYSDLEGPQDPTTEDLDRTALREFGALYSDIDTAAQEWCDAALDRETLTTLEREEELASLAFRDDRELAELEALGSAKRVDPYTTGEADSGVSA